MSDLEKTRDELDRKIEEQRQAKKSIVLSEIAKVMKQHGVTKEDLYEKFGPPPSIHKGKTLAAKYRDPVSGKTWAGRGTAPLWIRGKNYEDFII